MPAVSGNPIVIEGYTGLLRAFGEAQRGLPREVRKTLREVVEPVREGAEELALGEISHIGIPWSRMRVGITKQSVYVAPRERGVKGRGSDSRKRPNLAPLLLTAEEESLDKNREEVVDAFDQMLLLAGLAWERA